MNALTHPIQRVNQLQSLSFNELKGLAEKHGATVQFDEQSFSKEEIAQFILEKEQDEEVERIYNETLGG